MNIRVLTIIFLLSLLVAPVSMRSANSGEVNPYNVPDELRTCMRAKPELEINGDINPFYISGDYDGDGLTDFAVQVRTKKDRTQGILFCFANGRLVLLGAGASVVWPQDGSSGWPFDSWILIRKGSKHLSIYPQIKSDTLALMKADEGGGLVYWDGKKFSWQREE